MQGKWYYQGAGGQAIGPLSDREFVMAVRKGQIGPNTLVGSNTPKRPPTDWAPAHQTPVFHSAQRPPSVFRVA